MKLGDYVSIKQAAELSGYSGRHLRYLIKNEKIDAVKVGNMWFIHEASLQAYKAIAEERGETDGRYMPKDITNT